MKNLFIIAAMAASFSAHAAVVQTVGSGSAVSAADAVANFESQDALNGNPYVENGITVSRTNLTFNNNGCGYAGCSYAFPFTGNYVYGVGAGGYFQIAAESGKVFQGVEFLSGSGYGMSRQINFIWEATLGGSIVGSGTGSVSPGTILGFSDLSGFDGLRWTETSNGAVNFSNSTNAPAMDDVRVQYARERQAVPEPAGIALLGLGLLGLAAARRKSAGE